MPYSFNPFTGNFDNTPSVPEVEGVYLPLSGGTITGNLTAEGNFEVGGSLASVTLIVSGSKIGINTETPNEALTVVGNISASDQIYVAEHRVIKTNTTDFPGTSAVTKIIAVSALPVPQQLNTLYILV